MHGQDKVDLRLWGKARGLDGPYPLVCHLLDVGAAVGVLWDLYLSARIRRFLADGMGVSERDARAQLMFWAALHDIGKATPFFQQLDLEAFLVKDEYPDAAGRRVGHDFAAHVWLRGALSDLGFGDRGAATVAQLLGGHHGCFFGIDTRAWRAPLTAVPELGAGVWEEQRRLIVRMVHEIVGAPVPVKKVDRAAAGLACGVVILADWLVSQTDFLNASLRRLPVRGDPTSLTVYFRTTIAHVEAVVRQAELAPLQLAAGTFAQEHGFEPNGLQRSVEQHLPALLSKGTGLLLVTAPMGVGKTEIALTAARMIGAAAGTPGVYFALPTMSTADQMYARLSEYGARRAVGAAPLALLHSMAWLVPTYQKDVDAVVTSEDAAAGGQSVTVTVADWLRGPKRGLLAPWGTGTIDQALMVAVRGKHNMLRLLGLAGKVLVVDEVHAYDSYMQGLLRVLLTWLGKLGVPVILLSATLPQRVAHRLVESYLCGAGTELTPDLSLTYPGWMFAGASTGTATSFEIDCPESSLAVEVHTVPQTAGIPSRAQALQDLLSPLVTSDYGCVGIICNTVAEAQDTFREMRRWFDEISDGAGTPPTLTLLHSRFPGQRRKAITDTVVAAYGKNGGRPRGVVISTQLLEQSIDLDFDLIISDLAPVALLLQRAGRGHRHAGRTRPPWADRPRLAVLVPTDSAGELALPRSWPFVYPESLLRRTYELLVERAGEPIAIPGHVQQVMEKVYDESFADGTMAADDIKNVADQQIQRTFAEIVTIPEPQHLSDLAPLTERQIDEAMFVTRLGADAGRVVCCFIDEHGDRWLDRRHTVALPTHPSRSRSFSADEVKAVLEQTIPIPASWLSGLLDENRPPTSWSNNPYLREIALLNNDGRGSMRLGRRTFGLDDALGLYKAPP